MAYSRAGYGQSDACKLPRPLDYLTREAVDVLPEVLDAIGFRRGVLMRHSDGATIAAIHAGSVADRRVRGLVLMALHFLPKTSDWLKSRGRGARLKTVIWRSAARRLRAVRF